MNVAHRCIVSLLLACLLSGCDSGSGGGGEPDDSDSGTLVLFAEPQTISPQSLVFVTAEFRQIFFDDIDSAGLTLKLLIPTDLELISGSGALTLDHGALPLAPFFIGPAPADVVADQLVEHNLLGGATARDYQYVIFSLPGGLFEEDDDATVTFNLQVKSDPSTQYIFADLDRLALTAFNPANSDFDAESVLELKVVRLPADEDE